MKKSQDTWELMKRKLKLKGGVVGEPGLEEHRIHEV